MLRWMSNKCFYQCIFKDSYVGLTCRKCVPLKERVSKFHLLAADRISCVSVMRHVFSPPVNAVLWMQWKAFYSAILEAWQREKSFQMVVWTVYRLFQQITYLQTLLAETFSCTEIISVINCLVIWRLRWTFGATEYSITKSFTI